jgi:hypothetical protein
MAIVLLSQLIPIADVAVGMVAVARESPATCGVDRCAWNGLILMIHLGVVAVSLVLSTILVALLSATRRRDSSPRSALVVRSIGAIPAIATLLLTMPGLITWANSRLKH